MRLNYSKKIFIVSIIIFVAVLVLDIIFINLLITRITSITDRVSQLNISSQQREKELFLADFISNSATERANLDKYFVGAGNAETVDFTKYLEALAKEAGVTEKKTLNYEPITGLEASNNISAIRYRFSTSGRWQNIFNFLQLLESLPKAGSLGSVSTTVNSEAVSLKEARAGVKVWSLDVDFSVAKLKI
jgi:hypothetical protein